MNYVDYYSLYLLLVQQYHLIFIKFMRIVSMFRITPTLYYHPYHWCYLPKYKKKNLFYFIQKVVLTIKLILMKKNQDFIHYYSFNYPITLQDSFICFNCYHHQVFMINLIDLKYYFLISNYYHLIPVIVIITIIIIHYFYCLALIECSKYSNY